ncbi:MAG: alpha/beta fold hydrolase, partial [Vibrio sp.]
MEHKIIDQGYQFQTHEFECPLDYQQPDKQTIRVVARSVTLAFDDSATSKPWLIYLQGGPGFESPSPSNMPAWVKRALKEYRVLFLDQRGTGQSTPATAQTLSHLSAQA